MKERVTALLLVAAFMAAYFLPFANPRVRAAALEAFEMLQEYARQHVLLCLVPALFVAGATAVFVGKDSVVRYFGARAKKWLAYSVASVSGAILAVCSCTILPLFAGIYKRGAGLGPAVAFLYSGPAINVLAIVMTARVLGAELGVARAVGAIVFSIVVGVLMHLIFLKEERARAHEAATSFVTEDAQERPLWKTAVSFALMIAILVFANWGRPADVTVRLQDGSLVEGIVMGETYSELQLRVPNSADRAETISKETIAAVDYGNSAYAFLYRARFAIAGVLALVLAVLLAVWFRLVELKQWGSSTWTYAKMILPLLFAGVLVAGFLLGRPGHEALIPTGWISSSVGGNSWGANLIASFAGALMYFATLTEVPILQGLLGAGMGKGPALALLLAGPALSLPNMLVIRHILGTRKTLVYVLLVAIMATISGKLFGLLF